MQFKLPFIAHTNAPRTPRKFRVDARRYWVFLLCGFVLALAAELVLFSTAFMRAGERMEAPATATLGTNQAKIKYMQTRLDAVDRAVSERAGIPASQNGLPVVQ